MQAVQFKMARAALDLSVRRLAQLAEVSEDAVAKLEAGDPGVSAEIVAAVRGALEARGIEFFDGDAPGVRLCGRRPEPPSIPVEDLTAENDE